jgi:probable biosynthetic protein (TIGR04098 family)
MTTLDLERHYELNMPQMSLGGLSEGWLFRELGDMHWTLISKGLRAPSSQLSDANGERLYATFTRLCLSSTDPLNAFGENHQVEARAGIKRFGGGVFFGEIAFGDASKRIAARLMSSFTKRSSSSSNLSLLKGQPLIPEDCAIPSLDELPAFAQEYRQFRSNAPRDVLFEHTYRILPYHDINGVGLLYFAAYPTINDLCEMQYFAAEPEWCLHSSTVFRDVHYYGNCNLTDEILYRLHERTDGPGQVTLSSSLSRASDGMTIARMVTTKRIRGLELRSERPRLA